MLAPYQVQMLPCVFFEVQDKLLSSTTSFRKRTNTSDRLGEDTLTTKLNMTTTAIEISLPSAQHHNNTKNWSQKGDIENQNQISVPKHKYDLLVEQNNLKDQKISTLQAQVRVLREKNEEMNRMLGIIGGMDGPQFIETTKLNQVTNQITKDRKRIKK